MGNEFVSGLDAAHFIVSNGSFLVPNITMALMWAAYVNLYGDYLPTFLFQTLWLVIKTS